AWRLRYARGIVRGDHTQAPRPLLQSDRAAQYERFLHAAAGIHAAGDWRTLHEFRARGNVVAGRRAGRSAAENPGDAEMARGCTRICRSALKRTDGRLTPAPSRKTYVSFSTSGGKPKCPPTRCSMR